MESPLICNHLFSENRWPVMTVGCLNTLRRHSFCLLPCSLSRPWPADIYPGCSQIGWGHVAGTCNFFYFLYFLILFFFLILYIYSDNFYPPIKCLYLSLNSSDRMQSHWITWLPQMNSWSAYFGEMKRFRQWTVISAFLEKGSRKPCD